MARWILSHETGGATNSDDHAVAAERVFQKLFLRLSRLISPTAARAILSRALSLTQAEFAFLEGVQAAGTAAGCLEGLRERVHDIEAVEVGEAVLAVLRTVLDILVEFIGEDLTFRVVHDVWLNVPLGEPRRPGKPDGDEAAS